MVLLIEFSCFYVTLEIRNNVDEKLNYWSLSNFFNIKLTHYLFYFF
jgi:hypothetical protein